MTDKFEELSVGQRQRCVGMVCNLMRLGVTNIDTLVERTHFPKAIVEACVGVRKNGKGNCRTSYKGVALKVESFMLSSFSRYFQCAL